MVKRQFEVIWYEKLGTPKEGKRNEETFDSQHEAVSRAKKLKNELGYFPVVVYDTFNQSWVDF